MDREWAEGVLSGRDASASAHLLRAALTPLSSLYGLGIRAYYALYARGLLRRVRLPCSVVSLGNLTVGGTGKTALTRLLARGLRDHGLHPAVLSYGYHGRGSAPRWVSDGREVLGTVETAGDEAVLLARALPDVPVIAGKRRADSGRMACQGTPSGAAVDCLLLDDGFQYWRLERDLDLVLVDATNPFGFGRCLPRGLLREPKEALSRAHGLILTRYDQAPRGAQETEAELRRLNPSAPVWRARYAPTCLRALSPSADEPREAGSLRGLGVSVLTSLGNPASFEQTVAALGARLLERSRFPDHHALSAEELSRTLAAARAAGAEAVVTSDKDAVKLRRLVGGRTEPPLLALEAELEVSGEVDLVSWVVGKLQR